MSVIGPSFGQVVGVTERTWMRMTSAVLIRLSQAGSVGSAIRDDKDVTALRARGANRLSDCRDRRVVILSSNPSDKVKTACR
jgi:hypothetical protein